MGLFPFEALGLGGPNIRELVSTGGCSVTSVGADIGVSLGQLVATGTRGRY